MNTDRATGMRIVTAEERETLTFPPMEGVVREQALADDRTWIGVVKTEPGNETGWHHHGDYETYVFMLRGEARGEWGPGGTVGEIATVGSLVHVPAGMVHREINTGSEPNEALVIRIGSGIPVVPVDGPDPE